MALYPRPPPSKDIALLDPAPQSVVAMQQHHLSVLITTCLILHAFAAAGLLALPRQPTDISLKDSSPQRKREPATTQEQGSINSVSTPGQQTQNATSTAGDGNSEDPNPGVITNPAATPVSAEVNCTDVTTGRDNKCWAELNLTRWVEDWIDTNACYTGEAFASCFLRKEGFPGLDCTGIKVNYFFRFEYSLFQHISGAGDIFRLLRPVF